jgi:hypothetical protein
MIKPSARPVTGCSVGTKTRKTNPNPGTPLAGPQFRHVEAVAAVLDRLPSAFRPKCSHSLAIIRCARGHLGYPPRLRAVDKARYARLPSTAHRLHSVCLRPDAALRALPNLRNFTPKINPTTLQAKPTGASRTRKRAAIGTSWRGDSPELDGMADAEGAPANPARLQRVRLQVAAFRGGLFLPPPGGLKMYDLHAIALGVAFKSF